MQEKTHFGYQTIDIDEKEDRVEAVFNSVADKYDLMNDAMSFGIHRLWKDYFVWQTKVKSNEMVLDLAAGTGDISIRLAKTMGLNELKQKSGQLIVSDINQAMLNKGRENLLNQGLINNITFELANAEQLPFADNTFDLVTMAFGLRNVSRQLVALIEINRILKPNGRLMVLEFSKPIFALVNRIYDWYSFNVLPKLGKFLADDQDSYQYLAESIRMHPNQENLKELFDQAGFVQTSYENLSSGIVAIHKGIKK